MPLAITSSSYMDKWFSSDAQFNNLYPSHIQMLSRKHWTPLQVSWKAVKFLVAKSGVRILDIGSGVGKFCLSAAYYRPKAFYFGVEQRKDLVNHAETARKALRLQNVSFMYGNFTRLDLRDYDHFYFYNSFYENLAYTDKIDDSIAYSGELYNYYNRYLYQQLEKMPAGTKLVTFHSLEGEVPRSFHLVGSEMDNQLKFWIKERGAKVQLTAKV